MFPLWACTIWQSLAHGTAPHINAFASRVQTAQDASKAVATLADGLFCDDCYLSPYPWPGPLWVRPSFRVGPWRRIADLVPACSFGFHLTPNTVGLCVIKTITRGSVTCVSKPLSSWRFVRPPFQPVLITILNAAALVQSAAQLSPMRLALTQLPARLLAVSVALYATIWAFAAKIVRLPELGCTSNTFSKAIRAIGSGGFSFFVATAFLPRKDSNV